MFRMIRASALECAEIRPGDEIVAAADVVMDRAFTVPGAPDVVWPWLVQLGKRRAGWYLPRRVEHFLSPRRRAARRLDPRWTALVCGDVIPDYGGRDETFTVARVDRPHHLVHRSQRGGVTVVWSIVLRSDAVAGVPRTRVLLRLRLAPVRRVWLARTAGGLIDLVTVAGLASGLRERMVDQSIGVGTCSFGLECGVSC
jgi:hypothetical protein